MATKICLVANIPNEKNVIKVKIPTGMTLSQGDQLVAESLIANSESIYAGTQVADITKDEPVIVINQGVYEDTNGARVPGYVNPGAFTYKAGDVITAVRPENDLLFRITTDCIDNASAIAKDAFLIPQNADNQLAASATVGTAKIVYKIEQLISIPTGNGFTSGVLARVYNGR